jgi:hypothetical protein
MACGWQPEHTRTRFISRWRSYASASQRGVEKNAFWPGRTTCLAESPPRSEREGAPLFHRGRTNCDSCGCWNVAGNRGLGNALVGEGCSTAAQHQTRVNTGNILAVRLKENTVGTKRKCG